MDPTVVVAVVLGFYAQPTAYGDGSDLCLKSHSKDRTQRLIVIFLSSLIVKIICSNIGLCKVDVDFTNSTLVSLTRAKYVALNFQSLHTFGRQHFNKLSFFLNYSAFKSTILKKRRILELCRR